VLVYGRTSDGQIRQNSLAPATFLDYRRGCRELGHLAAFREWAFNVAGKEHPERVEGTVVTPEFFAAFGVQAQFGRTLRSEEDGPGKERSIVLSHSLWQRRYGGSTDIIGRALEVDGVPRTVVGVMPPEFQYPPKCEAWGSALYAVPEHPLRPASNPSDLRDSHYFFTLGRLRQGSTLEQAQAEGDMIARRLKQQYGSEEEADRAELVPLRDHLVGETRSALGLLLGAVSLLLALACANVANVLLARGAARRKELAIRAALGASRSRLTRQLLTESLTLALVGGALGVVFAAVAREPLRALLPRDMSAASTLAVDARVLAFTAAVSIASAIAFGLFPARQAAQVDLNAVLKEGTRGSGGFHASRARALLISAEFALAAVLLIGAGLLIRSFSRLLAVPPGFRTEGVLSLQVSLAQVRYPAPGDRVRFVNRVLDEMRVLPGIDSVAAISRLPLLPGHSTRSVNVKGRTVPPGEDIAVDYLVITPDYLRVMGIRLLKGRAFTPSDHAGSTPTVLVTEGAARHFWPGEDPIGKSISGVCGRDENAWCAVVGVVEDVRQRVLDQPPRPTLYAPYARDPWPFMAFVVRTRVDPRSAAQAVEIAVHAVDPDQPVYAVRTMHEVVSEALSPRRIRTLLLGLFASAALALACVGIYGVMAHSVAARSDEIGIRMALGAGRGDVLRLVLGQAFRLSVTGIAAGLVLSLGLTRFLSTMLYGVEPTDAFTFVSIPLLLGGLGLLSSYLPAVRATRVDPMQSLRVQ
jgi:putative ABC transport system permease protein